MFHSARTRSAVMVVTLIAASLSLFAVPARAALVPGAPAIGTVTRDNGSATVAWTAPSDDGGSPITGYAATSLPGGHASVSTLVSPAVVTGLSNGTDYAFTVHATNAVGNSAESTLSNLLAATAPPAGPTSVTATRGNGQATVTWVASTDTPIIGYTVTSSGGQTVPAVGSPAIVPGLSNGTAYTFTVHATNGIGNSAEAASNTLQPAAVPVAPTSVTATRGNGSVTATWTASTDTPIIGYTVTSAGLPLATVPGTALTATGLSNGTAYTFTVHASNSFGNSAEASSNTLPPTAVPVPPTAVVAARGNGSVIVSWNASTDTPIMGYTVTSSGGQTVPAVGSPATVTGLVNGTGYTFTVHATNSAGSGAESAPSISVTPAAVPGPPGIGSVSAGNGSATVAWTAPAVTGGSAITGYTVTPSGGPIAAVNVSGSTFSATVTGLTNGTAYTFTVTATNGLGMSLASPASAPVTPGAPPDPKVVPAAARSGYWMVGSDGVVYAFGDAKWLGNAATTTAVDLEPTPSGNGYWVVDDVGRISTFGDAVFYPRVQSKLVAGEKVTSLSATRSGGGYWIFTSKGRVLTFGDAQFFGDVASTTLNGPVLDSIITPSGKGYFLVASDGGIFAFGDAVFHGSMGGQHLNAPVQSLVPDSDGVGYWLVAGDGGIFAFDAAFKGSMGSVRLNRPITGMVRAGDGYLMVGEDGGIFDFSGTLGSFKGSLGANPPARPIVSVAALEI